MGVIFFLEKCKLLRAYMKGADNLFKSSTCNFSKSSGKSPETESADRQLNLKTSKGILHSPVYTFFEKVCIIELNGDGQTGNSKFEIR
ncbi:MAG: hypothetical protein BA861_04540 [Desulfobacterales bacterium S3730MH5]|nr:MAG: hypothetical protein BA861_04540 [Desulfobacterales bacterium S3730MH5]OEU83077.1 MAG: hypothetical protein BA865_13445 [Desulfobacterales bacterium S5133MH4]